MVCACNPTVTPTAAPTSADAAEVITGSFALSGLTTSDVTNEFAAAIKDSLAASLTGVDSSMVVLTFTAATSRRMTESLRGVWGWTGRRLSSGLSVSYTITGLSAANAAAAATTAGAFDSSETFADSITTNLATIGLGWEGGVSGSTAAAATDAPTNAPTDTPPSPTPAPTAVVSGASAVTTSSMAAFATCLAMWITYQ
jgi:hypothetical protein